MLFCHSGCSGNGIPESHGENLLYEIPAFAGMTEEENPEHYLDTLTVSALGNRS